MSDLGNREVFANNLNRYISNSGKERRQVCDDLGIPYSTLSSWIRLDSYPRIDKIEAMARYFKCEKSDLIEQQSKGYKENRMIKRLAEYAKIITGDDLDLAIKIKELTESDKDLVKNMVNSLAEKKEQR